MTIESGFRWRGCFYALGGVLAAWFAGVLVITLQFEPTNLVVVVGPASAAEAVSAAEQAAILDRRSHFTRVMALRPGFVRSLYSKGAWFVWPLLDGGCVGPPA